MDDLTESEGGSPRLGSSVSTSGDLVVYGTAVAGVHVFENSRNVWLQIAKVTASDAGAYDSFGTEVSISGSTIVVGAYNTYDGGYSGAAYVFEKSSGNAWRQSVKLAFGYDVMAFDYGAYDYFGSSVSISGRTIAVGAYGDDERGVDAGAAYIFEQSGGGAWTQTAKLRASDAARDGEFGWSVSLSGNNIVIGACQDEDGGSHSGSAYVFARIGSSAWIQTAKLVASDEAAYDYFGSSVSISGGTIAVGNSGDDDAGSESGSAYVFEKSGGGAWTQTAKLVASDAAEYENFGSAVASSGDTVVVGAYNVANNNGDGYYAGLAYVFEKSGGGAWTQSVKFPTAGADPWENEHFGNAVAVFGGTIAIQRSEGVSLHLQ